MTMHKALNPRYDIDRLYVSRKEGGRGLARFEDSVNASVRELEGQRKINYSDQIQHWQHKDQQNNNK